MGEIIWLRIFPVEKYTLCGYMMNENLLYYEMPVNEVIAASVNRDKYTMLLYVASKAFDDYFYFFSMPYNTVFDRTDADIELAEAGKDYSNYNINDNEFLEILSYKDAFFDKDAVYEDAETKSPGENVSSGGKGVGESFYDGDIFVEYVREYTSQEAKSINMYYVSSEVFLEKVNGTYTIIIEVHNPLDKPAKIKKIDSTIGDGNVLHEYSADIGININSEAVARIYIPVFKEVFDGLDGDNVDLYSYSVEIY